jgi:hypothetical protein
MRRLRSLVILLMALWLPLQAVVAVAMPFCQDVPAPAHSAPSHDHHGGHHGEGGDAADGNDVFPLKCNDCGPCHLACAPMVGVAASIAVLSVSQHLCAQPPAVPPARILDQPHPPPLA